MRNALFAHSLSFILSLLLSYIYTSHQYILEFTFQHLQLTHAVDMRYFRHVFSPPKERPENIFRFNRNPPSETCRERYLCLCMYAERNWIFSTRSNMSNQIVSIPSNIFRLSANATFSPRNSRVI